MGKRVIRFFSRRSRHREGMPNETTSLLASPSPRIDEEANLPAEVIKDSGAPPLMHAFTFQSTVNLIVYCLLCLHTITYDQLLPVLMSYPRDDTPRQGLKFAGGFSMPSSTIGFFYSTYGVIGILLQVRMPPLLMRRALQETCKANTPSSFFSPLWLTPLAHCGHSGGLV